MFAGISAEGLEKGIFIGSSFRLRLRFRQYWFTLGSLRRKHDGSRRGDERKRNRSVPSVSASVELPLVLPSPFSWFTLERRDSSVSASVSAPVASVNQALVHHAHHDKHIKQKYISLSLLKIYWTIYQWIIATPTSIVSCSVLAALLPS